MKRYQYLSDEQIETFCREGILVVPNVLEDDEVSLTRDLLHQSLCNHNCNPDSLLESATNLRNLSSTGGAGGILDVFYEDWKLKINENPRIVSIFSDLWYMTYCHKHPEFTAPYGIFNPLEAYMYIDRICYRVPESVSSANLDKKKRKLQRSLTPHLDCCPHNMFNSEKEFPKWRPIQAFIALTDTLNPNEGGFEACPGHHIGFESWATNRAGSKPRGGGTCKDEVSGLLPPPCVGDFTPIRPIEDKAIIDNFRHIPCRAGDLVCWDYRIPHANARFNNSSQAREAVYIGLLPSIEMNKAYAREQLRRYRLGILPSDQWHEESSLQMCDYSFSELGRRLMGIEDWQKEGDLGVPI